MKKIIMLLVIVLSMIGIVEGVTIVNSTLTPSDNSNITVHVKDAWTFDRAEVGVNYVYLDFVSDTYIWNVSNPALPSLLSSSPYSTINFTDDIYNNTNVSIGCFWSYASGATNNYGNIAYLSGIERVVRVCCYDTASVTVTGLVGFMGIKDYYTPYLNDVAQSQSNTDSYSASSCGVWRFGRENTLQEASPVSYTILTKALAVVVALVILILLAIPIYRLNELNWTTQQWLYYFISGFIAVVMYIILLNEIFLV